MAPVSSVSGTNSSNSIYGNRNVFSGLASGMDTESMIENAVSGIKARITSLQQRRTKVEWQQESYRNIISKMVGFTDKYTSYTSSTNLLSPTFFNNAVTTTASGKFADMVTASGKTSNNVALLGVRQLASAARYTVGAAHLSGPSNAISGDAFQWGEREFSAIDGTMTLAYGTNNTVMLRFDELTVCESADELAAEITKQLGEQTITFSSGASKKASDCIDVQVDFKGNITFADKTEGKQAVAVSSMSGNFKNLLGNRLTNSKTTLVIGHPETEEENFLVKQSTTAEYLEGKSMTFTLDGATKTVQFDDLLTDGADTSSAAFQDNLQKKLDTLFGSGKISVQLNADSDGKSALSFQVAKEGSSLRITSTANEALGLDAGEATTYLSTGKTLGDLGVLEGLEPAGKNDLGKNLYSFVLNGVEIGQYTEDTALETILVDINNNTEAGVKASYSRTTNEFVLTAKDTGEAGRIDFGDNSLGKKLFGGADAEFTKGTDAVFTVSINDREMELTRSSNVADLDGLQITLGGTFGYTADGLERDDAGKPVNQVTFSSKADADKIVDAVKSMVEDYNAMVKEIKDAYSTMPAEKSNGARYEPLTDADLSSMSESAIKAYEEKAKQGILFADSDLSSLYQKLRSASSASGLDGSYLRSIGLSPAYSDGLSTLEFNETKLRAALESDPDKVKEAFTKSKESGSSTNGLMTTLKNTIDNYASKTGSSKGVLIEKAGSPLAPTSILKNSLKDMMDNIDKQISSWETKLSDQVDRYTTKFARLEQLVAQMNSQSSMLAGLMGSGS